MKTQLSKTSDLLRRHCNQSYKRAGILFTLLRNQIKQLQVNLTCISSSQATPSSE